MITLLVLLSLLLPLDVQAMPLFDTADDTLATMPPHQGLAGLQYGNDQHSFTLGYRYKNQETLNARAHRATFNKQLPQEHDAQHVIKAHYTLKF